MVVRPDPKNIIKQLIQVQNFDVKTAIKEQRTQPFDFFLKKTQKPLPAHLIQSTKTNKESSPATKLFGFGEALKIVKSYLFAPTPIYLNLKLNWPKSNYSFPKYNRLPVNPKIIPESTSPVVMVFAEGDAAENCKQAGADYVGGMKLLKQIQKYGMIPVDDCFCEMKQLPGVTKMAPFLGKYTPSVKRSTAYENIASFIRVYKQWNYLVLTTSSQSPSTLDKDLSPADVFYDSLTVRLSNSNQENQLFHQQLAHIIEQLFQCAKPLESTMEQQPTPIVHQCELAAKNAPTTHFDPFADKEH